MSLKYPLIYTVDVIVCKFYGKMVKSNWAKEWIWIKKLLNMDICLSDHYDLIIAIK